MDAEITLLRDHTPVRGPVTDLDQDRQLGGDTNIQMTVARRTTKVITGMISFFVSYLLLTLKSNG